MACFSQVAHTYCQHAFFQVSRHFTAYAVLYVPVTHPLVLTENCQRKRKGSGDSLTERWHCCTMHCFILKTLLNLVLKHIHRSSEMPKVILTILFHFYVTMLLLACLVQCLFLKGYSKNVRGIIEILLGKLCVNQTKKTLSYPHHSRLS